MCSRGKQEGYDVLVDEGRTQTSFDGKDGKMGAHEQRLMRVVVGRRRRAGCMMTTRRSHTVHVRVEELVLRVSYNMGPVRSGLVWERIGWVEIMVIR